MCNDAQQKYSTYDRELTAIYLAVRHFHNMLEGVQFSVFTDHKLLVYAFDRSHEREPIVRQRQLSYISIYTTSFYYLTGEENLVADFLSRVNDPSICAIFT